jgi:hypothetical protein
MVKYSVPARFIGRKVRVSYRRPKSWGPTAVPRLPGISE